MLCSRVQNLLSAYCDHELTGAEMLQIRGHLSTCSACRQEQEAILQVKRLMGALSSAQPPRPFDPEIFDTAARRPLFWSTFCRAARPYVGLLDEWRVASSQALTGHLRRLRTMPTRMALSGSMAITLVAFALVHAPQHPDAVSAHVPESVSFEDRSLAALPLNEVVPLPTDSLPDEVSAVQAAETIGAEQPIRLVSYDTNVPARGFETVGYPGYAPYQAAYSPVTHANFVNTVSLGAFDTRESFR